jgi:hypothetical protein
MLMKNTNPLLALVAALLIALTTFSFNALEMGQVNTMAKASNAVRMHTVVDHLLNSGPRL